nr:unnamed protein product [Spirometra erinaceieuropaei]
MNLKSSLSATSVHELLFADDCALNATSERNIKKSMGLFADACENFGLITKHGEDGGSAPIATLPDFQDQATT